jgi:uncharacterized protein
MRHYLRSMQIALLVGLAVFAAPAAAQKKPPDAAALTAAQDLLAAIGAEKQLETMIPLMLQSMRGLVLKTKPNAQKEVDESLAALASKFQSRRRELLDQLAPLYAERISQEDMKAMAAFFRTPAGQRFIALQPELMREGAVLGQRWGQQIGQEVETELRQELKKRGVDL